MNESSQDSGIDFWTTLNVVAICAIGGLVLYAAEFRRSICSCVNACINNLRQIDGAIQQWGLEQKKDLDAKVTLNDITPYLKNTVSCPQGGTYTIGPVVSNVPTCSHSGHKLPP
ncbi:MAG TPA: hypothetical protein VI454_15050 [Verrucomicrobiae bacterium]